MFIDKFLGCSDKQPQSSCARWRSSGYCADGHRFEQYMRDNCKKTCGFCGNVQNLPPTFVSYEKKFSRFTKQHFVNWRLKRPIFIYLLMSLKNSQYIY